ncbi:MauE/DoxX family redox-associated membrane protein [Embleya sp. NPDC008237]|uniref:MauE/DoxX family redox-associated membrane protein n=1 Tax=Embleya sp. NPDC008237 TaxID=3363978 RepID=UPI0036E039F2
MACAMELAAMSCRALLWVVLAVAVVSKLHSARSFAAFVRSVRAFAVVPARRARAVGCLVVGAETAGIVLLSSPGPAAFVGFVLVGCLLAVFTLAMAVSLRRGVRVSCRCFGASAIDTGPLQLGRNGFLIVVAAIGAVGAPHGLPDAPGGLAVTIGIGLITGVTVTVLDDVSELLRDAFPVAARKGQG